MCHVVKTSGKEQRDVCTKTLSQAKQGEWMANCGPEDNLEVKCEEWNK